MSATMKHRGKMIIIAWATINLIIPLLLLPSVAIGVWLAAKQSPYFKFYLWVVLVALVVRGALGLSFGGHAVAHRLS